MSEVTKNGITMTYTGTGNETVPVTGEVNEGIDRSSVFIVAVSQNLTRNVTVNQAGLREIFNVSDGSFLLADGIMFNVLKS